MPTRYSKQNELQQLQYEITNEISRDAKPIADGVFGNNARHPDMSSISNQQLDEMYRQAYLNNNRDFLMQEAQRDPQQFLAVTDRLGVPDPPVDMQGKPTGPDPNALQKALVQPPAPAPTVQPQAAGPVGPAAALPQAPLALPPQPAPLPVAPTVPTVQGPQPRLPGM